MDRWSRFAPLNGLVAFVLVAIALAGGPTVKNKAAGSAVISYYEAHRSHMLLVAFLTGLGVFFLVFFYATLRDYLRQDARATFLTGVAFAGAILLAASAGLSAGGYLALADVPSHLSPAAAQTMNILDRDLTQYLMGAGVAILLVGFGLAILRTGILPRWLGWVALPLAVLAFTPYPLNILAIALGLVWTAVTNAIVSRRTLTADRSTLRASPAG